MVGTLTFGAAAIAGVYNWATNVYSYNRDAWMTDMQVVQEYRYQKDNLRIQMQGMQREEVRDLFQASINKINNAILVSTLILSLAGEMLFEGQIPHDCPTFVLNAYMLCLGSAIFHLVLSIVFGIYGSTVAYTVCTQLLTRQIKPQWRKHFQQMKDQKQEEATSGFEGQSLLSMLKPPLISRCNVDSCSRSDKSADVKSLASADKNLVDSQPSISRSLSPDSIGSAARGASSSEDCPCNASDQVPSVAEDDTEWAIEWKNQEKQWIQYTTCMNTCVAFGTKNLLEACGYLCTAMLYGKYSHAWAFWVVQLIFTGLNILMMQSFVTEAEWPQYFRCMADRSPLLLAIIPAFGPMLSAAAAATAVKEVDQICVPLGYLCHLTVNVFQSVLCFDPFLKPPDCKDISFNGTTASRGATESSGSLHQVIVEPVLDGGISGHVTRRCTSATLGSVRGFDAAAVSEERSFCTESPMLDSPVFPEVQRMTRSYSLRSDGSRVSVRPSRSLQMLSQMEEFDTEAKVKPASNEEHNPHDMLLCGLRVLRMLWIGAVLWAVCFSHRFKNDRAPLMQLPKDLLEFDEVRFSAPSPFFKALTVTCPSKDRFFMADQFRVWSLTNRIGPNDQPSNYSCVVSSKIADIGSRCENETCWPVVLLQGLPPRVYDCHKHETFVLRKTFSHTTRIAINATNSSPVAKQMQTLYAAQGSEVLEYGGDGRRSYFPQWIVAKLAVSVDNILGLDIAGDLLVVFQKGGAVTVQHLGSGEVCGTWKVPLGNRIIGGGCAYNRSMHFLVEKDLRMSLQKAELPESVLACGSSR